MNKLCIGDKLQIQCYKHNGQVHRAWSEAVILDIKKDYIVFGNNRTMVTKAEGIVWKTREPAIMYFFKNEWFNVIAQIKKGGIFYYCNIATPFIIEEKTIKYIDYDLDLRIFPTGEYKILDQLEYNYHKRLMNYSDDLEKVVENAMDELIKRYRAGAIMFNDDQNKKYCNEYFKIKEEEKNSNFS